MIFRNDIMIFRNILAYRCVSLWTLSVSNDEAAIVSNLFDKHLSQHAL